MTIDLGGPLLLVGGGKMGSAMAAGWLEQGLAPENLLIQDPHPSPDAQKLIDRYGLETAENVMPARPPVIIVLAVKPQMMSTILPPLAARASEHTVFLSIAAGQSLATLEKLLGGPRPIVRAMPNTPAAIGEGMTVACSNALVSEDQVEHCISLLAAVGEIAWLKDESLMDAVTAVSGSGPAYLFALTECLAKAGIREGLDEDLAWRLATKTMEGAAALMQHSSDDPTTLRHNVTSPGGTTQAALDVLLADDGLPAVMNRAVEAAAKRSKELSG